MSSHPRAYLKAKRVRPFLFRHPWVFSGAIERTEGEPVDGGTVDLLGPSGDFVARGLYNSNSQIVVRLYTWDPAQELDVDFWASRIRSAAELREGMRQAGTLGPNESCRMINSEGDGLSGLTVDLYPPYAVVQFLSLGLNSRRQEIVPLLGELVGAPNLYERSDEPVSRYEGMPARTGVLMGEKPPEVHETHENGFTFRVDLRRGHKTGYYLDQKANRARAAAYAREGRVLDLFCYTGAFGIHAARAGASVLAVDESGRALGLAKQNAEQNGLDGSRYETRKGSAVPVMRQLVEAGERFDTVILDPPKFAHSRHELNRAMAGYRENNVLAFRLVKPNGILFTCSCSGAVTTDAFQGMLHEAAHEAGRDVQTLEVRSQNADHPVALACPESRYLKCLVCRAG